MKTSDDGLVIEFEKGEEIILPEGYEWRPCVVFAEKSYKGKMFTREVGRPVTDLEKFIELYRSVGIELEPVVSIDEHKKSKGYQYVEILLPVFDYVIPEGTSVYEHNIYFDESGKFIQQGIWE
jgi:hypothetical protein